MMAVIECVRTCGLVVAPDSIAPLDAAKNMPQPGGHTVSKETACGVMQGNNQICHTTDANMVAAAHKGMRKAQGGCTWKGQRLGAWLESMLTCNSLSGRTCAGRTCAGYTTCSARPKTCARIAGMSRMGICMNGMQQTACHSHMWGENGKKLKIE